MKIYLTRHGQTLFNVKNRIQGWCDSALTKEGIEQAKAVGVGLQDVIFTHAYASTSERAIDTASYIIGEREIPLQTTKGLKEMNFGTIEGEYEKDYLQKDGSTHDLGFTKYGGETIAITGQRMASSLTNIAMQHPQENVLVVSHGGAIMCSLIKLFDLDIQKFRKEGNIVKNGSVTIIDYQDGVFTLETFCDTSFLENGKRGNV